jgi:hypothetical protein
MADDLEVSPGTGGQGDQPPGSPAGGGAKKSDAGADELKSLRAEVDRLKKSNEQLTESERYWAGLARRGGAGEEDGEDDLDDAEPEAKPTAKGKRRAEPEPDEDDLDDPAKFVDALSAKGPKVLDAVLRKRGFLTAEGAAKLVQDAIQRERHSMSTDAELVTRFPDLKDAESELSQETGRIFREAVKRDPAAKRSAAALLMAAELAEFRLAQKAAKTKAQPAREDDDERETERRRRVEAQQGARGTRGRAEVEDEPDDDYLGPQAQAVIAALGVKPERYLDERRKQREHGRG